MVQEIKYNGCSDNPSDYECADGELAMSLGLVPEEGALKPVMPPRPVFYVGDGCNVVYIHVTSAFKHYITKDTTGQLAWIDEADVDKVKSPLAYSDMPKTIYQINAIGNVVVILTDVGVRYLLWKADIANYKDLGYGLPEIPISFGLRRSSKSHGGTTLQLPHQLGSTNVGPYAEEIRSAITEQLLPIVNSALAENANDGYFSFPFFVRYALRLYDGSLTRHSAPILMPCVSGSNPTATCSIPDGLYSELPVGVDSFRFRLDYALMPDGDGISSDTVKKRLLEFADIVKSVDIFVSAPIYTYDQNGECDLPRTRLGEIFSLSWDGIFSSDDIATYNWTNIAPDGNVVPLPVRDSEDVFQDIRDCSTFYLLDSIPIEELATKRTIIKVEEGYLTSLVAREQMSDDYGSHDTLIPQYAHVYNARLNFANLGKRYFGGFDPVSLFCFCGSATRSEVNTPQSPPRNEASVLADSASINAVPLCYVFVRDPASGNIMVRNETMSVFEVNTGSPLLYMFYPDSNAFKAQLYLNVGSDSWRRVEITLTPHDFLNGSFFFNGWEGIDLTGGESTNELPASDVITTDIGNKLYSSEVNNPFFFPLSGIVTVGIGRIYGISSAAKALSQGQFGQFPLYAFSTEGVWALEVSSTGTYSARQPITRDVCINPDSITQIDSAVLFATDRGIMLISGSETRCISDVINSDNPFSFSGLPKADKIIEVFNKNVGSAGRLELENVSFLSFKEFLANCGMIYDYVNQRIFVYNPRTEYAYVFSLKSALWGMAHVNITSGLNSYPEALAMSSNYNLVDLSHSDAQGITALVVTRPFKLGYPDVLKTIDTVIQRGYFQRSHVTQILYASRDLFNWHLVWSSVDKYLRGFRGSPYKAFRLALICKLDKSERLYGCSVQFVERMNEQLR